VLLALRGLEPTLRGELNSPLSGVVEDSRRVVEGSLFVVRRGQNYDGRAYVAAAERAGAGALLTSTEIAESNLPQIVVSDIGVALGRLAQLFAGDPSATLPVLAVTGTNGKTTTTCLVEQALRHLGRSPARIGTLGFFIQGELIEETLTTPSAVDLAQMLASARRALASEVVMEVSSHALVQSRVEGVHFAAAGLTNLTQDHLDFHGSMAAYGDAKSRLFFEHAPKNAVLNADDPLGRNIIERWLRGEGPHGARLIRYSSRSSSSDLGRGARSAAEISVGRAEFGASGLRAELDVCGQRCSLASPLLGAHNLENLLLSLGFLRALEIPTDAALDALGRVEMARGRLERVSSNEDDIQVLVDYAHTPDALERALMALGETGARPLWCIFGCGGDRDRTKRPLMGEIAARLADRATVTSDNPRSEDPAFIAEQILDGVAQAHRDHVELELDRKRAIDAAIEGASPGTTLLIAGKGHETYQLIGKEKLSFDDAEVARAALSLRRAKVSS